MYVTRRLSMYKKDPSALSLPPPDGPNTGILVIKDIDNDSGSCCWCWCCWCWCCCGCFSCINIGKKTSSSVAGLMPFPQNTNLRAESADWGVTFIMAIPVLNKPLSTSLYYILDMNRQGYAVTCSKGRRMDDICCFCFNCAIYEPRPLESSNNIYQQFYIIKKRSCGFKVKPLASDGHLPAAPLTSLFSISPSSNISYKIDDDAFGLDHSLRQRLPGFDFPLSRERSDAVIVGKWYCPFVFVKERHVPYPIQMSTSMFYEMILKQQWLRVFSCFASTDDQIREGGGGSVVDVDVNVETQVVDVVGMKTLNRMEVADGTKWFHGLDAEGGETSMGLDNAIIEKIKQDQASFGWIGEKDKVERVEKLEGKSGDYRKKFGCYMLVEKYVLRRMDQTLVFTHEFRHTHQVRYKWE